jgi:CDP-glucose 4,6-dehydratase
MEVVAVTETSWAEHRVLVTGATGMVGSWLVERLVDKGAFVAALVADHDPRSQLLRSGTFHRIAVTDGRLEDHAAVERAVNEHDVDTIFHLGAQTIVGTAHRSPRPTLEANIQGTWNVLEAWRLHPDLVKSVVVASSDKAYGEQPVLPYTEDMSLTGRHPYEVSKSCTDLVAQMYAHTYGAPVAIARCGNIYGGGDLNWSRIVPGTIRSLLRGEQPVLRSDGKFLRDYIHVDDVVGSYLALADALLAGESVGEAYNFSDEKPQTVLEIYAATCAAAGMPDVEPLVLDRAVGEIRDQYLDAAKAREQLGWKASVSLADGLRRTVDWYRELFAAERSAPRG